jgi:hypothetical protein
MILFKMVASNNCQRRSPMMIGTHSICLKFFVIITMHSHTSNTATNNAYYYLHSLLGGKPKEDTMSRLHLIHS